MAVRAKFLALTVAGLIGLSPVLAPVAARADGDPASDVLLGENVFYPYTPTVSVALQRALNAETSAAAKAHVPIRVALIASPVDLGVIPDLFGQPQKYADFLDQEISFQTKLPLLVVMYNGYGVQGLSPAAQAAAAGLPKPAGKGSDALAQAAIAAVRRLAAASGHPIAAATAPKSSGGGGSAAAIAAGAVAVVAVAGAVAFLVWRRRRPTAR